MTPQLNVWGLIVFCVADLVASVACMDAGKDAGSLSTWEHELIQAYNSDITFSSDDSLISAGADLDRELQSLHTKAELSALVAQLRRHEEGYVAPYYHAPIAYVLHNKLDWSPSQLDIIMKEHFKSAHRNIALLDDSTIITANIYRNVGTNPSLKWGLGGLDSQIIFWSVNPARTEVTFKGLVVVSPVALIKHLFLQLPRLVPDPSKRWDFTKFVFRSPDRLKLRVPLVPKPS